MKAILGSTWTYALLGLFLGFSAVSSGMFREGGGLVLLMLDVGALFAAALFGILSTLLHNRLGVAFKHLSIFCFVFCLTSIVCSL
jgi:hypothetical protein